MIIINVIENKIFSRDLDSELCLIMIYCFEANALCVEKTEAWQSCHTEQQSCTEQCHIEPYVDRRKKKTSLFLLAHFVATDDKANNTQKTKTTENFLFCEFLVCKHDNNNIAFET